jgi:hypothetical protein
MVLKIAKKTLVAMCLTGLFVLVPFIKAHAVPSFARQTGMSCNACHTVWPELTPFGRSFKLDGYTMSTRSPSEPYVPPVAAMFEASYTSLGKNSDLLKDSVAPFASSDDSEVAKFNLPQQASIFYGGRIINRLGAFVQATYDGPGNAIALDNTDIRYSGSTKIGSQDLVYGFTIDNNPTVEDLWNTTPAWGFPFASSAVAPTPAAAALIDGGLAQQVGGIGAYASWSGLVYGAFSVYRTTNDGITRPLGAGTTPDIVTDGAVPYGRIALHQNWGPHSVELGAYGLRADVYPSGATSGPTDRITDYAFDAQYEYIASPHMFTFRGTWIHEKQDWDASFPMGNTMNPSDNLETWKINASYFYQSNIGTLGGSVGYFSTTGDTDAILYSPGPVSGSNTGSPESKGFILQVDYLLKENYKFSLQYTIYDRFNGAGANYDGFGRDASDNNTLYFLVWLMF